MITDIFCSHELFNDLGSYADVYISLPRLNIIVDLGSSFSFSLKNYRVEFWEVANSSVKSHSSFYSYAQNSPTWDSITRKLIQLIFSFIMSTFILCYHLRIGLASGLFLALINANWTNNFAYGCNYKEMYKAKLSLCNILGVPSAGWLDINSRES
jgi:hypothetical protein